MAYQIVAIPVASSVLQHHSPVASLLKCDFSYSCAAADKVSADIVRHTVAMR